jgi:hypothetical protein
MEDGALGVNTQLPQPQILTVRFDSIYDYGVLEIARDYVN